MKTKNDVPEVFSCFRKAFEYVKKEVEQSDQDIMDCMLRIFADDKQAERRYELLELDFHAELEWEEKDEDEIPVCNIASVNVPLHLTEKGKETYSPLFEVMTEKNADWIKEADVEVKWLRKYKEKGLMIYPVQIRLCNSSPEMASRFISFICARFLPEGKDTEIWTEFLQEFDAGYEWVQDILPDEGETMKN